MKKIAGLAENLSKVLLGVHSHVANETLPCKRACRFAGLHAAVAVMCCLFGHLLVVLDDAELYEGGTPLPLHHLKTLVEGLKRPLFAFCWDKGFEVGGRGGGSSWPLGSFNQGF